MSDGFLPQGLPGAYGQKGVSGAKVQPAHPQTFGRLLWFLVKSDIFSSPGSHGRSGRCWAGWISGQTGEFSLLLNEIQTESLLLTGRRNVNAVHLSAG